MTVRRTGSRGWRPYCRRTTSWSTTSGAGTAPGYVTDTSVLRRYRADSLASRSADTAVTTPPRFRGNRNRQTPHPPGGGDAGTGGPELAGPPPRPPHDPPDPARDRAPERREQEELHCSHGSLVGTGGCDVPECLCVAIVELVGAVVYGAREFRWIPVPVREEEAREMLVLEIECGIVAGHRAPLGVERALHDIDPVRLGLDRGRDPRGIALEREILERHADRVRLDLSASEKPIRKELGTLERRAGSSDGQDAAC